MEDYTFKPKNIIILSIVILMLVLTPFSWTRIPGNAVGVKESIGGVVNKPLKSGFHFKIPFFEKIHKLPTSVQNSDIGNISTQTRDGQYLITTINIQYQIDKENAMKIYSKYTNVDNVTNVGISRMLQRVIETAGEDYDIFEILGSKRAEYYKKLDKAIKKEFKKLNLEFVSFTIIDQEASEQIENAIKEEAVKQKQVDSARQEQEKVKIEAETAKIKAQNEADTAIIKAKGEAEANRELSASLTDNIIRMKEAEARLKHGWINTITNEAIVDAKTNP